jgi:hypothetical protein
LDDSADGRLSVERGVSPMLVVWCNQGASMLLRCAELWNGRV